ncbi:uncharacterized protein LOC132284800 [Cornus florida]|uniref:uncharacterized protein LOC132284800 n=1 Tax=Cornus florida TaxID=4283 RepID=UPI0028A0605B|nr:uncharacterized protein LOC132284800 [Cornus florida]
MVAIMKKWAPWPPAAAETRKFQVKLKPVRLEGFDVELEENSEREKVMVIEMRWKGGPKGVLVPFHRTSKMRKSISTEKTVRKGESIEWDKDEFENVCDFSIGSKDNTFGPWDVSFRLLYGEKAESKAKLAVIGKVSLNLAEWASTMESGIERKIPISFRVAGVVREATLSVYVSFVEIRNFLDSAGTVQNSTESKYVEGFSRKGLMDDKGRGGRKKSQDEVGSGDSDESIVLDSGGTSESEFAAVTRDSELSSEAELDSFPSSEAESEPVRKAGFFSWKRRRVTHKPAKTKVEPLIKKTGDEDDERNQYVDRRPRGSSSVDLKRGVTDPSVSKRQDESGSTSNWEVKELVSRDGQTKLKANVFMASFDQRSDKAAGESACTALVAVIAHWLQTNQNAMPTRSEFDSLIVQGSSEWRTLCQNEALLSRFPDKHFDLETVLQADLCPLSVLSEKSFVGFFGPEKFESLKELMSFDGIWNDEISSNAEQHNEPRVYIVSWNDHFFVLKVEANAYYIIDTLGERLFEGCNQAFILKFDESALMEGKVEKEKATSEEKAGDGSTKPEEEKEREEVIWRGKECCREFIKRFLAAIPLKELEEREKKETVSYFSLHQRLQIEFNFSSSSSSSSSSANSSSSSLFINDDVFD